MAISYSLIGRPVGLGTLVVEPGPYAAVSTKVIMCCRAGSGVISGRGQCPPQRL